MSKPANLMVILQSSVKAEDLDLLSPIIHKMTRPSGDVAHVIWCKTAKAADGGYLSIEAKLTERDGFANVRIQGWLVLAIAGSEDSKGMGFVWEENAPPQRLDA